MAVTRGMAAKTKADAAANRRKKRVMAKSTALASASTSQHVTRNMARAGPAPFRAATRSMSWAIAVASHSPGRVMATAPLASQSIFRRPVTRSLSRVNAASSRPITRSMARATAISGGASATTVVAASASDIQPTTLRNAILHSASDCPPPSAAALATAGREPLPENADHRVSRDTSTRTGIPPAKANATAEANQALVRVLNRQARKKEKGGKGGDTGRGKRSGENHPIRCGSNHSDDPPVRSRFIDATLFERNLRSLPNCPIESAAQGPLTQADGHASGNLWGNCATGMAC
ncbi:hypothetical protein H1R20_g13710, partial [Candolleomyces eurysporus]